MVDPLFTSCAQSRRQPPLSVRGRGTRGEDVGESWREPATTDGGAADRDERDPAAGHEAAGGVGGGDRVPRSGVVAARARLVSSAGDDDGRVVGDRAWSVTASSVVMPIRRWRARPARTPLASSAVSAIGASERPRRGGLARRPPAPHARVVEESCARARARCRRRTRSTSRRRAADRPRPPAPLRGSGAPPPDSRRPHEQRVRVVEEPTVTMPSGARRSGARGASGTRLR